MKDKITKLIDVKTIITILLTAIFGYLTISGKISSEQFLPILTMILTYYFTRKKDEGSNE